jgi:hypothetical protein
MSNERSGVVYQNSIYPNATVLHYISYIKSNIDGFLFEIPSGIAISIHVVAERIII